MKNPLNKRLWRELRFNKSRYLAIFILLIVTIGMVSAFFLVQESTKATYLDSLDQKRVEDGQISFARALNDQQTKIFAEHQLDYVDNFYLDLKIDGYKSSKLRLFAERKKINLLGYYHGRAPKKTNEIVIERIFASNNQLKVGDKIKINRRAYRISGIAAFADYSTLLRKNNDILPDNDNFCLAMVKQSEFDRLAKTNSLNYRYSYRLEQSNLSEKEQTDKLNDLAKAFVKSGQVPISMATRSMNKNISFFYDDMGGDVGMIASLFVLIIFILALVFTVLASSMIEEEARPIGTLLALGYQKTNIVAHYMLTPLVVTIISILVGNLLAYTVMKDSFANLYLESYSLMPMKLLMSPQAFSITSIFPASLVLIINLAFLLYKLRLSANDFLRKSLTKRKFKHALKLPKISFLARFRLRVLLRNLGHYLILILGIFMAQIMFIFSFSYDSLFAKYFAGIEKTMPTKVQTIVSQPLSNIDQKTNSVATTTVLKATEPITKSKLSVNVYGVDNDRIFQETAKLQSNQILVSKGAAEKLDLKVGDELKLYDKYRDREYKLKVTGRTKYFASSVAVLAKRQDLNLMLDYNKNYYNDIFSNQDLNLPKQQVLTVIKNDDMVAASKIFMSRMVGVSYAMMTVGAIIFVAVIFVLTKSIIDKYKTQIAYLRIFGYTDQEINKVYIRVSSLVVIGSILLLIPLEKVLLAYIYKLSMLRFDGYLDIDLSYLIFFKSAAVLIVIYFFSRFLLLNKVKKVNMEAALKDIA